MSVAQGLMFARFTSLMLAVLEICLFRPRSGNKSETGSALTAVLFAWPHETIFGMFQTNPLGHRKMRLCHGWRIQLLLRSLGWRILQWPGMTFFTLDTWGWHAIFMHPPLFCYAGTLASGLVVVETS